MHTTTLASNRALIAYIKYWPVGTAMRSMLTKVGSMKRSTLIVATYCVMISTVVAPACSKRCLRLQSISVNVSSTR